MVPVVCWELLIIFLLIRARGHELAQKGVLWEEGRVIQLCFWIGTWVEGDWVILIFQVIRIHILSCEGRGCIAFSQPSVNVICVKDGVPDNVGGTWLSSGQEYVNRVPIFDPGQSYIELAVRKDRGGEIYSNHVVCGALGFVDSGGKGWVARELMSREGNWVQFWWCGGNAREKKDEGFICTLMRACRDELAKQGVLIDLQYVEAGANAKPYLNIHIFKEHIDSTNL